MFGRKTTVEGKGLNTKTDECHPESSGWHSLYHVNDVGASHFADGFTNGPQQTIGCANTAQLSMLFLQRTQEINQMPDVLLVGDFLFE